MASIDDGELLLDITGATRDELQDGLIAARRIFIDRGVAAADAFAASLTVSDPGCAYTPKELEEAAVLDCALEAAERAACAEWKEEPEWSELLPVEGGEVDDRLSGSHEPHYRLRPFRALPELPLGLPPLPELWPGRELQSVE